MSQRQLAEVLTGHGVRPTQQRMAVYDYLLHHRTHPSAEAVYEALIKQYPTFSRTTVYNSLHALVDAGLVAELTLAKEERRYDADVSLHGHFCCRQCGRIADLFFSDEAEGVLNPPGYRVEAYSLSFSGLCPDCGQAS